MKYIRPVFFLFLVLSLPVICSANWQSEHGLKVAVMEIVSRVENESIDAATVTDMLQARFVEKKKFTILERAMLNKIIEEKKLYLMGLTDTDASKVGAMAGADKIITGSISRMGDRYVILMKGIDTRSGAVEVSDQELISSIRDLPEAVKAIADRVIRKASGEPVEGNLISDRNGKVVFDERFQNNQNGWSIGDWDAASASIIDGQYIIRMKSQAPIFHSKIDVVVDQDTDFDVEATVAKLKGSDENLSYYGIIFGRNFENMYEFLVHPNGKCMIRYLHDGKTEFIQSSATSSLVNRGNAENTLRIQRKGENLRFYLNGQLINQYLPMQPVPNAFLIGYETWRTEGEKLVIVGKQIKITQTDAALQANRYENSQNDPLSVSFTDLTSPGSFTRWMAGDEFGKEMDKHWKNGYYPGSVEGRNNEGKSEYRAVLQPFPKKVWWFYWWYGQLGSSYVEHRKRMTAEGFKEVNLQVFTDKEGMNRYQTCWIKYDSTQAGQTESARVENFIIKANAGWQNTVKVTEGKTLGIKASGHWNHGEEKYGSYGPQGCGKMDNSAPLPDACIGTLIGRINNSQPFAIGPERTFTLTNSGVLQFSINDWGFEGNTGSMNVEVVIK